MHRRDPKRGERAITIYTKAHCDKCDAIKKKMKNGGVEFSEQSTQDREVMKGLVENGTVL